MSRVFNFVHNTGKSEYNVRLTLTSEAIQVFLQEKFSVDNWSGSFNTNFIQDELSKKAGNPLSFQQFSELLLSALQKKEDYCYVDILTSQDLQNLRAKKGEKKESSKPSSQPKSNKRYIILTSMRNDQRVHYPLPLNIYESQTDQQKLKAIYKQVRQQLDNQRLRIMNETSKSQQSSSFSINYQKKGSRNHDSQPKQIDQLKSQNEILKSKLKRLQEQAQKKAGSDMQAIIQRKNQLQKQLETPNMKLVDLRYNVQQQQEMHTLYKAQLLKLHKQISQLLVTDKEIKVKKHAQEVQRDLENIRRIVNKNTAEIEKLKNDLEKGKQFNKELQIKAKKLNTQKDVIKRGRRGPYSSYSGSIRSGSSRASSFGGSVSSKRSNYSYNSQKFR